MSNSAISIPVELQNLLGQKRPKRVLLLGGSDTGKTTLLGAIARHLAAWRIGIIDADPGQSHIGPPTTIGWVQLNEPFDGWENLLPRGIYFTGSTSPYGNLLPILAGIVRAIDDLARANVILLDTSGFILGPAARVLIWHTVDVVGPDLIIAIQRSGELEPVLEGLPLTENLLLRLPVHPEVKKKSPDERRAYRVSCYEDYFKTAKTLELECGLLAMRTDLNRAIGPGSLVSLRDDSGKDLALGIIEEESDGSLRVFTPLSEGENIACLVSGRIRLLRMQNWQESRG